MKIFIKYLGAATVLVLGILAVGYLQYRFDKADLKNAIHAVRASRIGGPSDAPLELKLAQKYGIEPEKIFWVPKIESKVQGTVVVPARLLPHST